jgi:hypothetical protein
MRLIDEAGCDGGGVLGRTAEQVQRAVGPLEVAVRRPRGPRRPVVSDLIIW